MSVLSATATVLGIKNQESDGAHSPHYDEYRVRHIDDNATGVRRDQKPILWRELCPISSPFYWVEVVRLGQKPGASQRALVGRVSANQQRPNYEHLTLAYLHRKVVALLARSHRPRMDGFCMHFHYCRLPGNAPFLKRVRGLSVVAVVGRQQRIL